MAIDEGYTSGYNDGFDMCEDPLRKMNEDGREIEGFANEEEGAGRYRKPLNIETKTGQRKNSANEVRSKLRKL